MDLIYQNLKKEAWHGEAEKNKNETETETKAEAAAEAVTAATEYVKKSMPIVNGPISDFVEESESDSSIRERKEFMHVYI